MYIPFADNIIYFAKIMSQSSTEKKLREMAEKACAEVGDCINGLQPHEECDVSNEHIFQALVSVRENTIDEVAAYMFKKWLPMLEADKIMDEILSLKTPEGQIKDGKA